MLGTKYTVKKGDTLWDLSKEFLGDPTKWPDIYEHNNKTFVTATTNSKIVDPDLIFVNQTIYIPTNTNRGSQKNTLPPSAKPQPFGQAKSKARPLVCSIPLKYTLDDIPVVTVMSPTHIATITYSGDITLQSDKKCGFVTLTKDGFEVNAKNEADLVLGKLLSDNKVSWNANAKTIKFENGITINSNNKFSPSTTVSMGVSPTTKLPVAKVTLKSSPVKGALNNHTYVTSEISITIELTPIPPSAKASPIPSAKPVPASSSNGWDYLIAGSLIAGAAVIVIATIAEDIVTAGAGVADDPASFSAAAAMITRGITMIKRVQTNTAIMIEGASIGAVNMAH